MSYREDGEIRDGRPAGHRRHYERRRSRSPSRGRRRFRPRSRTRSPPRRPRHDDLRKGPRHDDFRGGPRHDDRRRRDFHRDARRRRSAERKAGPEHPREEVVKPITQPEQKPAPAPALIAEFAAEDGDGSLEIDEKTYVERVERQLQSIQQSEQADDVEEELRLRRERRQAMVLSLKGNNAATIAVAGINAVEPAALSEREGIAGHPRPDSDQPHAVSPHREIDDAVMSKPSSDDDVDIFGDSPIVAVNAGDGTGRLTGVTAAADNKHLIDNWDDAEGYYSFRLGDVLNDARYEVFAYQGRGVFSTVLRVRDRQAGNRELVVKVIRQNDVMYKAGLKEVQLLKILGASDPDNHRHCVRLYCHFEHRGHLCLVFEPLHLNLREVLKKYGGVGINVDGVRSYARQLFVALRLLAKCEIVHADIKPDNILVNAAKNVLKLCDFGSAGMVSDCDITPYLVSRFYRAPEIILGLPYGPPIDVWAVGCVLFELYTGQILFKGADNNEMLLRIMELRGRFPPRLLRKATFATQHFDDEFMFERRRTDKVSGTELKSKMRIERPSRDLQTLLRQSAGRLTDADMKSLSQLRDLLEKCLMLDPAKRITPEAARLHPFLQQ